jgi:Na+-driven multidrug efflux pump
MTNDPILQGLLAELIPLFAIGNIALSIGTISWTLVGAQGSYRLSTGIGFAGSWLVTIPLSVIMSIVWNFDMKG